MKRFMEVSKRVGVTCLAIVLFSGLCAASSKVPQSNEFTMAPLYGTETPTSIAVADFNGDGIPDVATGNNSVLNNDYAEISVLLGTGGGKFGRDSRVHCKGDSSQSVTALATADVNGDGKADIIATQSDGEHSYVCVLLGNGDGTFQNPLIQTVGSNQAHTFLVSLGVGDFNGDGKVDVAVADDTAGSVYILLGKGDGTFVLKATYILYEPGSIAVGDINHDEKLDLVIDTSGGFNVFLGAGDGTFTQLPTVLTPGFEFFGLAIADFNQDGNPDVAVTSSTTSVNYLSIYFGNGDGTFQSPVNYVMDLPSQFFVTAGDLNHDGVPDLVDITANGVEVLLNFDHGSFGPPVAYATDLGPTVAAIHDFNTDGHVDIAVANGGPNDLGSLSILLGNGDGTFLGATNYNAGNGTSGFAMAATGDFDLDGKGDVAVATQDGVSIFLTGKNGVLKNTGTYGSAASSVSVGDLNRDGKPDLVTLTGQSIGVMLGNGDGTFQEQVTYAANATSLALGDFNGDGKLDVVVTTPTSVTVYLGNGGGTLGKTVTSPAAGPGPITVADFNGDGKLDLAIVNSSEVGGFAVLLGNGDGTFGPPVTYFTSLSPNSIVAADLNSDGKLDLVIAGYSLSVYVALGNGDGTFQPPVAYSSGGWSQFVAVADFNGDGKLDVAAANPILYPRGDAFGGNVSVLLGNGDGTLQNATTYIAGTYPSWVGALDLNNDGAPDLVSVNNSLFHPPQSMTVFLNLGGTVLHLASSENPSSFGQPVTFTTTAQASVDKPNRPTPTGMVTFRDGKNVLGTVKLTKGKTQFSTSKLSVGTHSITAHYSGDSNFNPHTSDVLKQVVKK